MQPLLLRSPLEDRHGAPTLPPPPRRGGPVFESYQKAVRCDVSVLDLGPVFGAAQLVDLVLPVCWARGRAAMEVVLNDGSVDQLKCLERAAECHRKASTAISPAARSRFQDAASLWLSLADSYALSDRSPSSTLAQQETRRKAKAA